MADGNDDNNDNTSPYTPPPWCKAPQHSWSLAEIKNGVEVAVHPLSCTTTLGRQSTHIEMLHPSISRLHARIAFDTTGTPWLKDLQSAHGVTVNKKPLPAMSIGQDNDNSSNKPGARGVVIYPGDILRFGASTRLYCVNGPPAFERGQQQLQQKLQRSSSRTVPSNHDTTPPLSSSNDTNSSDDHHLFQKERDRIQALQYKLDNIQTESKRIQAKAELTEGQERQLQRNEEKQTKLQQQLATARGALQDKQQQRKRNHNTTEQGSFPKRQRLSNAVNEDDDEVDDFYDQTNQAKGEEDDDQQQTEDTLLSTRNSLCRQRRSLVEEVQVAQTKVETARQKAATADEESAFFAQNDLTIAVDEQERVQKTLRSVDEEMKQVEKLLRIVNPNITFDKHMETTAPQKMKPPPPVPVDKKPTPPPQPHIPAEKKPTTHPIDMLPPPPRKTEQQPAMMLPPPRKVVGPCMMGPSMKKPEPPPQQQQQEANSNMFDTWQAPANQDGSGRTKLNDKFAGRY